MEAKTKKLWLYGVIAYASMLLLITWVVNTNELNVWLSRVLNVFRPLLIGLVLAYLLNPFFRFFENKVFEKISPFRLRRTLSLIFTYLLLFLIFALLLLLIVPQLIDSITDFLADTDSYLANGIEYLNTLIKWVNAVIDPDNPAGPLSYVDAEAVKESASRFFTSMEIKNSDLIKYLSADNLLALFEIAGNVIFLIADIIFGFFISIYLLSSKEKRYAQVMRLRRAVLNDKINEKITRVCTVADRSFGGFLEGKIIDSAIVAVLVYIAISIFDIPYAILIATIVGITDIVPVIGPFVGVIPSSVIILLTDPGKVIPFLLCILVIQQIDGNIIAPKILGENTGVSSLCVIIAITVMGSLWGLLGMVLGVPLFATILELVDSYLEKRLRKKGIHSANGEPQQESGGLISRFKRKALRLQEDAADGGMGDLTRLERLQLSTYELAVKHHIFSETTDDALARFATERAALLEAAEAAERVLTQENVTSSNLVEVIEEAHASEETAEKSSVEEKETV